MPNFEKINETLNQYKKTTFKISDSVMVRSRGVLTPATLNVEMIDVENGVVAVVATPVRGAKEQPVTTSKKK